MQQVTSSVSMTLNQLQKMFWNWSGNGSTVPPFHALEIGSITLNYFPSGKGTVGRCLLDGRDATNTAVWRMQVVYVEPFKTKHLTFPLALRVEAGGWVEAQFTNEGPGTIELDMNGRLV